MCPAPNTVHKDRHISGPGRLTRLGYSGEAGFTLIELLVVISIIALLIGILLPALGAARRTTQAAVCLGHQRGLGQAVASYVTDGNDFLPGPNTSGSYLWENDAYRSNRANEPVQSWDWISPTLGNSIGFSDDPLERYKDIYETGFKCPSNDVIYDYQYRGITIENLTTSSYTSPMGFQSGDPDKGEYYHVFPIASPNPNSSNVALEIPKNTGSKIDAMGPPSIKMWAMDGSRYVDDQGRVSFDTEVRGNVQGGNFMSRSPALATSRSGGSPFRVNNNGELLESSLRTGFRHNERMNGVFLDGHANSFDIESSRPPEFYFPSGSKIIGASFFVAPVRTNNILR